jgi:anti-sigma B factor antagonist
MSVEPVRPPANTVAVTTVGDTVTVSIAGEVDLLRAPTLATVLRDLLRTPGYLRIAVDLRGVSFMDSTGIQILVAAYTDAAAAGRTLRVIGVSPPVRRILRLTGVLTTLGVED